MKVILSGGAGFIGRHVLKRLLAAQHSVTVVDILEKRVHGENRCAIKLPGTLFYACDCADTPYYHLAESDVLIHLAAQVGVADSQVDPLRYIMGNTVSTAKMLDTAARSRRNGRGPKLIVVASSMSVYGDGGLRVSEDAPTIPSSVYGLTKLNQEQLCLLFGRQYNVKVIALRLFNCFGPGQSLTNPYTGVLANFAQAILEGKPPTVYEDGKQTRDFIYVEDVADAIVQAAFKPPSSSIVLNVCTGIGTEIREAARLLAKALGRPEIKANITGEKRLGDVRHVTGNALKTALCLAFRSRWDFERGIAEYAKALQERPNA